MTNLDWQLLPWQRQVAECNARFKCIAAGGRVGKTHGAVVDALRKTLNGKPGKVWWVAPTQNQAMDTVWDKIFELAGDIIVNSNSNKMWVDFADKSRIQLKGADRPDTLRGVSLKHLVLDEYAFMKPDVWDSILRPALSDMKGTCTFIGTPEGRNHFYDLWARCGDPGYENYEAFQFTSYENPFVDRDEIDEAKRTLPRWAFEQEYMGSFSARGNEYFDIDNFLFYDEIPKGKTGDYYMAIDLAGFRHAGHKANKKRDNSAIAVAMVDSDGDWWVEDIISGQWTFEETAQRIFQAHSKYRPAAVGIERGIAQQAVLSPLKDYMAQTARFFNIDLLTHGNAKKEDRILYALQGRFENQRIHLKRAAWNDDFLDEAANFPSKLVHDDRLDALAYIDQLFVNPYLTTDYEDDWEPYDDVAGY